LKAAERMAPDDNSAASGPVSQLMRELAAARERIHALENEVNRAHSAEVDALAASGERLRLLLGNLQELILVLDTERRIVDVAGNCMGLVGYSTSELCDPDGDVDVLQLFDRQDRERMRALLADVRLHPQGESTAVRVVDRAGEERWVECTAVPLYGDTEQQCIGVQLILRDISERVRSEQMMRSLNQAGTAVQRASLSLDEVLDVVTEQLHALDLNSAIGLVQAETGCVEWVKIRGDARFMQAVERLRAEFPGFFSEAFSAVMPGLEQGEPAVVDLHRAILSLHAPKPVVVRQIAQLFGQAKVIISPLRAESHNLGYLVVVAPWLAADTVPAIQAFANQTAISMHNGRLVGMLAESETQYRAIFESARDGMIVLDSSGHVVAASETVCALFALSHDEMMGKTAADLFTLSLDEIAACCQEDVYGGEGTSVVGQALPSRGEPLPVELRGSRITYGGQVHLLVLITDISERIQAQEALIQSERLSALGQMAGGIAHDFNNILVSILGYTQMAIDDIESHPERLTEDLTQIEAGARDAADAVSRLQALYRDTDDRSDFVPIQLDEILMDALALNRPRWKDIPQLQGVTYRIETQLRHPAMVLGNPGELRRVLSNLLINAIDAMPEGGVLSFESAQSESEAWISIRDTGVGISPEIQQRVFEPFYTTKKSSGLGLAVCANIVRRHSGSIQLESKPGEGTCITVRFPIFRPGRPVPVESRVAAAQPMRPLAVLVIDDEPHVRAILARVLERQGHTVSAVSNGHDGLAALAQGRYDLLICDLGMPELPGSVVMQRARAIAPHIPIILATGWGETITPDQLKQMRASALLSKPFGQEDVRRAVAQAVQAGPVA